MHVKQMTCAPDYLLLTENDFIQTTIWTNPNCKTVLASTCKCMPLLIALACRATQSGSVNVFIPQKQASAMVMANICFRRRGPDHDA